MTDSAALVDQLDRIAARLHELRSNLLMPRPYSARTMAGHLFELASSVEEQRDSLLLDQVEEQPRETRRKKRDTDPLPSFDQPTQI